jgi:hypothetical protein
MFHVCGPNPSTSYENQNPHPTGSSNLLGKERHFVAESFKLPDRTLCQPRAISLLVHSLLPDRCKVAW